MIFVFIQGFMQGFVRGVAIQVRAKDREEARNMLDSLVRHPLEWILYSQREAN